MVVRGLLAVQGRGQRDERHSSRLMMRYIDNFETIDESTEEPLVIHRRGVSPGRALIVLLHGLGGRRYGTWTPSGSDPTKGGLARFLYEDIDGADVGMYAYRTLFERLKLRRDISLERESEVLADRIREQATVYDSIILAGHSMGGILAKATVCELINRNDTDTLSVIRALMLLATPQAGSLRVPMLLWNLTEDGRVLKAHGAVLARIQKVFTDRVVADANSDETTNCFVIPTYVVAAAEDRWVDKFSAGLNVRSARTNTVRGSHTSVVKPRTKTDDAYKWLRDRIREVFQASERPASYRNGVADVTNVRTAEASEFKAPILAYLRSEAKRARELPVYFPDRLRRGAPFGHLRQRIRVADRAALEQLQMRQRSDDAYAPHRAKAGDTLDWDDDVADHFTRAIVLGEPGAGKSWLLRYDMWRIAERSATALVQEQTSVEHARLPILVHLAELQRLLQRGNGRLRQFGARASRAEVVRDALVELVVNRVELQIHEQVSGKFRDWLTRAFETNQCVVLFDALDEVAHEDTGRRSRPLGPRPIGRSSLGEHLVEWSQRFPDVHTRVTMRDAAFQRAHPPLHAASELVLLSLNPAAVERFATTWFNGSEQATFDDFKEVLDRHQQMRELARNPLMLALMCRVLEERKDHFPLRRVEFYDRCVRGLLREWKEDDKKHRISVEVVEDSIDVLARVSRALLPQSPPYEEGEVSRVAQEVLPRSRPAISQRVGIVERFKEDGLLVPVSARPGSPVLFIHRTLQEYLAGIDLVSAGVRHAVAPDDVREAATMVADALEAHVADSTWREVILLGLGYVAVTQTRVTKWREALASSAIALVLDRMPGPTGAAVELMGAAVAQLPGALSAACVERVRGELIPAIGADGNFLSLRGRSRPGDNNGSDALEARVRAMCGDSLGQIGDPRFHGADRWYLPDDKVCGFARSDEADCLGFIWIPAGTLQPRERQPLAGPPMRPVDVRGFYAGRWPVTVAQFAAFSGASEHQLSTDWQRGLANHPVVYVSWFDAQAYCVWLTEQLAHGVGNLASRLRGCLAEGWRVRLLTEIEWEYAAGGIDGRMYPWGNDKDANRANCAETHIDRTSAVGCFPGGASPFGVEDVAGNVLEWMESRAGDRDVGATLSSRGNVPPQEFVRGGAFYKSGDEARLGYGFFPLDPGRRDRYLGFRVGIFASPS